MTYPQIAVTCTNRIRIQEARQLAHELQLTFIDDPHTSHALEHYAYFLVFTPDYLGLISNSSKQGKQSKQSKQNKLTKHHKPSEIPFYIDFLSGKLRYRSDRASLRKE